MDGSHKNWWSSDEDRFFNQRMGMNLLFTCCAVTVFNVLLFGQIEQISTGYTQNIGYICETDSAKYLIAVDQGIIRYSKTTGNIDLLPVPHYPNGYNAGIQLFGDSLWYMSTIYPGYPYPFTLSKSTNKGETWNAIFDTICDKDLAGILVLDTNRIYLLGTAQPSLKTTDGGNSWTATTELSQGLGFYRRDDSIIFQSLGPMFGYTLDNGYTWQTADNGLNILNCDIYGLHIKELDSIYSVLRGSCNAFSYCFSGDYSEGNWHNVNVAGVMAANSVYAASANEVYMIGYNDSYNHRIAKTTDLGTSWQIFDPGINGEIYSITPLNDSVFLVSGKYGSLYKWNKNQTQWGSLGLEEISKQGISISPNPSGGVFRLESETAFEVLAVTDFTGRNVNYSFDETTGILNVDEPAGMYFVQFGSQNGWITQKLVVE